MDAPKARVQLTDDRLQLEWPAVAACTDLSAHCRLGDGTVHESASWRPAPGVPHQFLTECGPLHIRLQLRPEGGRASLLVEAAARTDVEVTMVGIGGQPRLDGSPLAWVLYNGYQSWDDAGHLAAAGRRRESWWTVGLADDRGAGIAAAAVGATTCCTKFLVSDGHLTTAWCEADTIDTWPTLFAGPAGTLWCSEEVLVSAGEDVRGCLGSLLAGGPAALPPAPVGWLSWYHLGPWVGRDDVLAHADLLAGDDYRRLGYRLIQIDDGWQQAYGEWTPNTKFPGGLDALTRELRGRGQTAGLWTAPFLVSAAADMAMEAPDDWFVVDRASGERAVDPRHRVFGPMHVLDGSHEGVQAHLRELFAGFYASGIRYFKIDFLYAGAYAGIGALRAGVQAIRDGVRDAQLVASGAPLLPLVGLVEGCRVGPDTATPQFDFESSTSTPTIFDDEVTAVVRNAGARCMLHPWFRLDADVALVGGNLSLEQGRKLVTLAALSGGPFFTSDDLRRLAPERLALLTNPEVLELAGRGTAVPDWEPAPGDRPATHWRRDDVLAIFNWTRAPARLAVRAPGSTGARDLWARSDLPEFGDGAILEVPADGVRLLRIRKAGDRTSSR